ncbi:hypothetical protein ACCT05_10715 [Rhizobium ruizarguesonis]
MIAVYLVYGMSVTAYQTGTGLLLLQELPRRGMTWDQFMALSIPDRMVFANELRPRAMAYSAFTVFSITASLLAVAISGAKGFGLLRMSLLLILVLVFAACIFTGLGMGGARYMTDGDISLASGVAMVGTMITLALSGLLFGASLLIRSVFTRVRRRAA